MGNAVAGMDSDLPKRLFEEGAEPLGDKINKCARMSILKVLANNIASEYAEVKRDPLFANIMAIHENRLHFSAKMVHSFLTRQLVTAKKHELWFVFARRPLRFSLQEFHAVTGLKCIDDGNSDLNNWVDDGGFWSRLLKSRGKISLEMIRKKHIKEANKWTRLDRLRLVYFCVAGLLMAVDEKTWVSHDYIKLIMDFDKLRAYPWGLRCFDHLVKGVIKARSELSNPISYVLEGFAYALQIWIMEAIPDCGILLGKKLNAADHIFPRCANWSGAARAGFVEIINLENAVLKTGLVYCYISSAGNMDVIDSAEFTWNDEMRDERVDMMKELIGSNYD
uniref:DUF1985 domain-containing protein n=1 Tax=Noccaea caerulescens TaxID=107243 RepID=A0A1J3D4G3_NOCCA